MDKLALVKRLIGYALLVVLTVSQSACIKYSDGFFLGDIQYHNKTLPRYNPIHFKNYPVNCVANNMRFHRWSLLASKNPLATKPQVLFFTNTSKQPIYLHLYRKQPGASAGWLTKLDAQNWSVLSPPQKKMRWMCLRPDGSKLKRVNCQDTLNACWMTVKRTRHASGGGYWVSENRGLAITYLVLQKRGLHMLPPGRL